MPSCPPRCTKRIGAHSTRELALLAAMMCGYCPFLLLGAVEEDGQRVNRHGIAAYVGQPDQESQPRRDTTLPQDACKEEEALEEETCKDEDMELPLLPPQHCP